VPDLSGNLPDLPEVWIAGSRARRIGRPSGLQGRCRL